MNIQTTPFILHITTPDAWAEAQQQRQYTADSLAEEGFIHCSTPAQVVYVANERFRGRTDLILLLITASRVHAPIIYEDCYETGQNFPHIYGPLNLDAVAEVLAFPPAADGGFELPPGL
jgi:uncharacterized protein (DUF952 family)